MLTQTEVKNNVRLLNNIIMTDKLVRYISVSREKKLAKELKDQAKKSSEKLLILLMRQEVYEIMIQDILKSLLSIHKIIFQNLSSELHENINDDEVI